MIRTLLVGFGFSATTFHLPFLQQLSEFSLAGVVSSRPDDVKAVVNDVPVYASLAKALAADNFDLVVITTPNTLHALQARQALMNGVNVLVEKPFTLSGDEADELVSLATRENKKLCVYHNRRFDGDFLTVKSLIEAGTIGNVKRLQSRFDRFRPHPRNRWRENAGPGAGIFWDLGPHLMDQTVQLFGVPKQIHADVQITREGGESDDSFDITLFYGDKTVLLGSSPHQANTTLRFDLQGTAGSYRKLGLDPQEDQLKQGLTLDHATFATESESAYGEVADGEQVTKHPTQNGDYIGFYQQLARAITQGEALPADAESVVPVIRLIELAFESAETGKVMPVYLDMKANN
ncbi:Gfo/Idh/MocA family oxidoreductase [Alteromonas confluentis]|uniref:Oxidoreductase n=1 Tax=Alteromonas confluentis TaxID=1656094 RepID=A0A1E7ZGA8_9ALTE|nr:Gfo/Idh/MocA family oxidoreductase [Alteromonas confluentis]OFC72539.1 oxidoreductase [Alteromonas confluentis]